MTIHCVQMPKARRRHRRVPSDANARHGHRPGFTLVELMVVIGIIALLAAVLVVAIGRAGVQAREQATAALIRKVSDQVQARLEALDRMKSQPQFASEASVFAAQNNISLSQAKVLLLKNSMKKYFSQSFSEFQNNNDPTEYASLTANFNASTHRPETESSALLYYMLTQGKGLGIPTLSPGDFKSSEIADTDSDGLLEIVDAWGKPLRFYRWPTRLICPSGNFDSNIPPLPVIDRTQGASVLFTGLPANDTDLKKDQDDPTLLLYDSNSSSFLSQYFNEANFHTPRTYHHFLIVSSGPDAQKQADPDRAFGLWPPTDQSNFGRLAQPYVTASFTITQAVDAMTDNITNRNR